VATRIVQLARSTYAGFNDHHLCEKLVEREGFLSVAKRCVAANSPQAKGRIECLFGVLQDRLTSELRLTQATNIASANTVLRKFIADYNRRFARQARESATAWRETPNTLDRICCFVHERIVTMVASPSTTARLACSSQPCQGGDIFMLLLGCQNHVATTTLTS